MAIAVYGRERGIRFMAPLFNVVSPEKASDVIRQFRALVFPEDRYDALRYTQKAKEFFEKVRGINLYAQKL